MTTTQKNAVQKKPDQRNFSLPILVIAVGLILSILIFIFVFGHPSHFQEDGSPKEGDYLGIVHEGGFVVPILMTLLFTVIVFSIERLMTIQKAKGKGSIEAFLRKIKYYLESNDINAAIAECSKQKGSVANVVEAGLKKYQEMGKNTDLNMDQKVLNISKEIEEATSLEMPVLEKHLAILATIASISTLLALFGTVLGMIRAFAALASSGTPDPSALSAGISEALVNTAIGILTSAIAIVLYNVFTGMIDKLTYGIDEIGFSIAQTFASTRHDITTDYTNRVKV